MPAHSFARNLFVLVILLWQLSTPAIAAEEEKTTYPDFDVGWLLFGDLYYVASHHTEEGDGAIGGVIRRGYLTFDADFSERMFGRLRFELNQSGEFETYDYEVDFKDLYIGWKLGTHKVLLGLSPTPTFDVIEAIWDSRYLARTPMDMQGEASRDNGVASRGHITADGRWRYRAMLGTGVDFGNESDISEKFMGAVSWHPRPGWTVDFYADYESLPGPSNRRTLQAFVGFENERWRWGAQYSNQDREEDAPLELASAFVKTAVADDIRLIGRIDRLMEPSPKGNNISYIPFDPSAPATMLMGGIEFQGAEHFIVTPNIIWTTYDQNDQGFTPESDLHIRLTLFLDFE